MNEPIHINEVKIEWMYVWDFILINFLFILYISWYSLRYWCYRSTIKKQNKSHNHSINVTFQHGCQQGVWSSYLPDVHPEHVHPVCGQGALWLCYVCPHPPGIGGGNYSHQNLINAFKVLCCVIFRCQYINGNLWRIWRRAKDVSWNWVLLVTCYVSPTGCHLPSLPRNVGQVGTTFGAKSSGNNVVLWWAKQWDAVSYIRNWITVNLSTVSTLLSVLLAAGSIQNSQIIQWQGLAHYWFYIKDIVVLVCWIGQSNLVFQMQSGATQKKYHPSHTLSWCHDNRHIKTLLTRPLNVLHVDPSNQRDLPLCLHKRIATFLTLTKRPILPWPCPNKCLRTCCLQWKIHQTPSLLLTVHISTWFWQYTLFTIQYEAYNCPSLCHDWVFHGDIDVDLHIHITSPYGISFCFQVLLDRYYMDHWKTTLLDPKLIW